MAEYVGKMCPYCKTIITDNDNVVICSDCNMPHHKECWIENEGCTTFGCTGTIQNPTFQGGDIATTSDEDFEIDFFSDVEDFKNSYCPKCGSARTAQSIFCSHCGCSFDSQQNGVSNCTSSSNSYGNTYTVDAGATNVYNTYSYASPDEEYVDAMMEYVGSNIEYYRPIFLKFKKTGSSASWNWASFFVSFWWSSYRKMYGVAAAVFGIIIFLNAVSDFAKAIAFIGYIIYGIYGNKIYYNHVEKKMLEGKNLPEQYRTQHVIKNSGTSVAGIIVPIVGYFLLIFILCL